MRRRCRVAVALLGMTLTACDAGPEPAGRVGQSRDTAVVIHAQAPAASAFRAAVQTVLPALVYVQVEGPQASPGGSDGRGDVSSGSGVILSEDGLILTNNHVVENAAEVMVVLADNRRLAAAVVGRDPDTDIALLRIPGERLAPASLGDSDSLQVGDWVLALGYPLGLSATVTAGIVSGVGRSLGILRQEPDAVAPLEYFIQTDAAINPGNSGGPMIDLAGRVVGVNSAIASPTGYYTGYGFAIPINIARRVAADLAQYGEARRPRLGALITDVDPADAAVYGLSTVAGAEIVALDPQGPAAAGGAELGDVVVGVDSLPVRTSGDLLATLAQRRPGAEVRLSAVRYGKEVAYSVKLGQLPTRGRPSEPPARRAGPVNLGFAVAETRAGVVISEVDRYSAAVRAGVRPGQRIVRVNGSPVRTAGELQGVLLGLRQPVVISLRLVDPEVGETMINYEPEPLRRER